jgi:hypothetical protein
MTKGIPERIAALPAMNKAQLLSIWAENFHEPPPPTLRKELMVPILAYRIQEREYGGLSNTAREKLKQIAKGLRSEKQSGASIRANLKSGTRLIRSWGGEVHEVSVSGSGYEYRGKQFKSLSEIAREITGTRWSGPLFFGTKKKAA